ncbi:unnamed protein product [Rotaria magnacalcarata]|uniref:Uncharacterized protein n=4 Tax=Rotaria magnacalcarata TaxID=392030 RepID=A0A816X365_9BILA|nr:unnamed protein product [Rotaria magnacalcarata]CAF4076265.1 unnamed protein product [Rotaria magnacalcarata]
MSKKKRKARSLVNISEPTAPAQESNTENKSSASPLTASSSIIKGVCDDSLLNGTCENINCNLLHLNESIQLTDGHFHDRLLKENWSCAIEPLKNIEQFIGITNVHKSSMWNNTISIVPESLKSKIRLYEAYGIHPRYLDTDPYNDLLELRNLIQTRPMIAVGECGLDVLNSGQLSLQTEIFTSQIKLANEFHLPLIIHCRQLDQQLFDILKKTALDSSMKIQWHCCHSKGASVYREFLDYFPSSLLSIGGMCCHSGEKNMQKLVRELFESETNENQRRFVFETDSPYLKSSSLLINTDNNCPILGTLTASAYVTRNILKNDQWTENLKLNTNMLQKFFNLK